MKLKPEESSIILYCPECCKEQHSCKQQHSAKTDIIVITVFNRCCMISKSCGHWLAEMDWSCFSICIFLDSVKQSNKTFPNHIRFASVVISCWFWFIYCSSLTVGSLCKSSKKPSSSHQVVCVRLHSHWHSEYESGYLCVGFIVEERINIQRVLLLIGLWTLVIVSTSASDSASGWHYAQ